MSLRWPTLLGMHGVFVVGAFATGCAAPPDEPTEATEVTSAPIEGGYADDADTAVVGIVDVQRGGICTGSLLAPNMVLTARHCVSSVQNEASGGGIICSQTTSGSTYGASNLYVTTDEQMDYDGTWFQAQEVIGLPSDNKFCGQDQAIIILSENIPAELATPFVPRVDSALVKDEIYYAVGYGQTSDTQNAPSGSRRRRDNLAVFCAEQECEDFSQYMTVKEWIGDTGICSGDSGGPAIDLQNRVVGVTSRGSSGCENPIYGSVHAWGEWIKETGIYAAQLGGYEPASWTSGWPTDPAYTGPVGDSCDTGCAVCLNDICTRMCSDDLAPCPEGFVCEAFEDGQYCQAAPEPEPKKKDDGGDDEDDDDDTADGGGCSANGREDPTNPVPWKPALLGLAVLGLVRRRTAAPRR